MELFMNGWSILKIDGDLYYITDEKFGVYKQVDRKEFIEELKRVSWVCLTTWDKTLRQQYLDLVDYVKEKCN